MSDDSSKPRDGKWRRFVGLFLVIAYGIGSPVFALVEFRSGLFSQRFDYSPEFLYLVSGAQFICALLLFSRRFALWSLALLTVLSLGAIYSHFRIHSPLTALPSLVFTALQIWYGYLIFRNRE